MHDFNTVPPLNSVVGSKVSTEVPKPSSKKEDSRIEAFEKEYRESHPNGAYPQVEIRPKQETKSV